MNKPYPLNFRIYDGQSVKYVDIFAESYLAAVEVGKRWLYDMYHKTVGPAKATLVHGWFKPLKYKNGVLDERSVGRSKKKYDCSVLV